MKILVVGPYGGYNLGDEFILHCVARQLRSAGHEVFATSSNAKLTLEAHSLESYPIFSIKNRTLAGLEAPSQVDAMVLGGGQQIQEGRLGNPLWGFIPTIYHLTRVASRRDIPVIWWSVGVSEISTPHGRWMVRRAAKVATRITTRDTNSFQRLLKIGVDRKLLGIAPDPVLAESRLDHAEGREFVRHLINHHDDRPLILFAPANDYLIGLNRFDEIVRAVRSAAAMRNALVLVKAMDQRSRFDAQLLEHSAFRGDPNVIPLPLERFDPHRLKLLFAGVDLTVSTRMHALILAATQGTPWVNICRSDKMISLSKMLDVPFEPLDSLNPARLVELILQGLDMGRTNWQKKHDANLSQAAANAASQLSSLSNL